MGCDVEGVPGLALFRDAVPLSLQESLLAFVEDQLSEGRSGRLPGRTYTAPPAHLAERGQSREMLQFGASINLNRVEIGVEVPPLPQLVEELQDVLVAGHIMTPEQRAETVCINVYEKGNWLPPHVDNSFFARPFVTVSLLSCQNVLFGRNMTHTVNEGHVGFDGDEVCLAMPVGSALRLDGAAADVFRHAVPPATSRRVSFTLRRVGAQGHAVITDAISRKQANKEAKIAKKRAIKAAKLEEKLAARAEKKQQQAGTAGHGAKSLPIPEHLLPTTEAEDPDACTRTPAVELEHVQRVYDSIATQWHGTRYQAWPKVDQFVAAQPRGSLLGDMGCGNGKNLPACNAVGFGIGCDLSGALVQITASLGFETAVADVVRLPFRSGAFDATLCIAVLHHLSTVARRLRCLSECCRVLKVGGQALFYAWAYEQNGAKSGHRFAEQDVLVPFHVSTARATTVTTITKPTPTPDRDDLPNAAAPTPSIRMTTDMPSDASQDCTNAVPVAVAPAPGGLSGEAQHTTLDAEKQAVVFQRYCHVYREGEVEDLFTQLADWVRVEEVYWDTGNWAVRVRKVAEVPE